LFHFANYSKMELKRELIIRPSPVRPPPYAIRQTPKAWRRSRCEASGYPGGKRICLELK
jgi:hypothetical protein